MTLPHVPLSQALTLAHAASMAPKATKRLRHGTALATVLLALAIAACASISMPGLTCAGPDARTCQQAASLALERGVFVPHADLAGPVRVTYTSATEWMGAKRPLLDVSFEVRTASRPIVVTVGEMDDGRLTVCTY